MAVSVHEITMAAPDIVRVEVRDPAITKGPLIGPTTPEVGAYNAPVQRTNPNTSQLEWCEPRGANKDYLKFLDIRATAYLDRAAADVAGNYGAIGTRTVTAVYRKSWPYDGGICRGSGGVETKCISMRHYLYLKLNGNLASGSHTIAFPAGTGLPSTAFNYNDLTTRCSSIHVNQHGHRPGDITKLGYLSLWLPGAANEGAVSTSLTGFSIIDAAGTVCFTGSIALRVAPTDVEESNGYTGADTDTGLHRWLSGLKRYVSLNTGPLTITGITAANPGVVTYSGASFTPTNGQIVCLRGIGGMGNLEGQFVAISSVNTGAHTFAIDRNTTSYGTYASGTYLSAYDSKIYKTHLANNAATYVYALDYSAWQPTDQGLFRIWIPGLGVSDRFRVDETTWYQIAKNAAGGMFNQRNGMALNGEFGYTRPVAFRDGTNGITILKSSLPSALASEAQILSAVSSAVGDEAPWITATRATGWFGTHQDAADWDAFIYAHGFTYYMLLEFLYDHAPAAVKASSFGTPKSSATLGATYAGTDSLPDAVHEVIWGLDAYRRLQNPDGSVGSGIGYSSGGETDAGSGASWLPVGSAYILAPDHASNFSYAMCAAKLAIVLNAAGFTTLGNTWKASALAAWDWAEAITQNASGERDAYYITALDIRTKTGWSAGTYTSNMAVLDIYAVGNVSAGGQTVGGVRTAAAGVLFRLTGESRFGDIAKVLLGQSFQSYIGIGAREYTYAAGADNTIKTNYIAQFSNPQASVVGYSQGDNAYRNNGFAGETGIQFTAEYPLMLWYYLSTGDTDVLDIFQAGMGFVLGGNQYGHCITTGVGTRNFLEVLHDDSKGMGLAPPPGMTPYTFDPNFFAITANFQDDSIVNMIVENPTGLYEADFGTARLYEPYRFSVPKMEFVAENRYVIQQMEYTWEQTIAPQWIIAQWLHGWDGNTDVTPRKHRLVSWNS